MSTNTVREAVHAYFMQRAIELARRGWYTTRPNPRVGCVIVRGETIDDLLARDAGMPVATTEGNE